LACGNLALGGHEDTDRLIETKGTVNQVMSDGVMALFGAPQAHQNHAVRAYYRRIAASIS
jgi:class 3 adenylate cyclase